MFSLQPSLDQRHYDGLMGAARDVDSVPFARQDAVEAVCRLRARSCDVSRVHWYRCGMWGSGRPTLSATYTPRHADRSGPRARIPCSYMAFCAPIPSAFDRFSSLVTRRDRDDR